MILRNSMNRFVNLEVVERFVTSAVSVDDMFVRLYFL